MRAKKDYLVTFVFYDLLLASYVAVEPASNCKHKINKYLA